MTGLYAFLPIAALIGTASITDPRKNYYICSSYGDCHPFSGGTIEKGIRCETGTVPAAVSPETSHDIVATVLGREGSGEDKSEDLP